MPRHFAVDGDLIQSHIVAALSSVFPDGEDFFVRSVRHYRDQITDPALQAQVAGFIGQEAMHGREHRVLNDRLAELGYPTASRSSASPAGPRPSASASPRPSRTSPPPPPSSTSPPPSPSCCSRTRTSRAQFGHDAVRDLFVWHALEESEHKAVAFDVYKAVGGTERMRVWTMKALRFGFVVGLALQVVVSLLGDRATYRARPPPGAAGASSAAPRCCPRSCGHQLKDYDRPDFHPDDRDTDALVTEWRARLFGDEGALNDHLVGAGSAA